MVYARAQQAYSTTVFKKVFIQELLNVLRILGIIHDRKRSVDSADFQIFYKVMN